MDAEETPRISKLREAVLIHFMAFAAAGISVLLWSIKGYSMELAALSGISLMSGAVIYCWSLISAWRSLSAAEPLEPITHFCIVVLFELLVFFGALLTNEPAQYPTGLLGFLDFYAFPFFAFFFIVLTFIAAPVAWHMAKWRKPEQASEDQYALLGHASWLYVAIIGALTLTLLPPTLFVYCAMTIESPRANESHWKSKYLRQCPDLVRDNTADLLALVNSEFTRKLHIKVLRYNCVSADHLYCQLADPELESAALAGLLQHPPEISSAIAQGIAANYYHTGQTHIDQAVHRILDQKKLIRQYLDPEASLAYGFQTRLIYEIGSRQLDYADELKTLVASDNCREPALNSLANLLYVDEFTEFCLPYLIGSDENARSSVVDVVCKTRDPYSILLRGLDSATPQAAASILNKVYTNKGNPRYHLQQYYNPDSEAKWTKRIEELSKRDDAALRSATFQWIAKDNFVSITQPTTVQTSNDDEIETSIETVDDGTYKWLRLR